LNVENFRPGGKLIHAKFLFQFSKFDGFCHYQNSYDIIIGGTGLLTPNRVIKCLQSTIEQELGLDEETSE
jgi:hypothetical protein